MPIIDIKDPAVSAGTAAVRVGAERPVANITRTYTGRVARLSSRAVGIPSRGMCRGSGSFRGGYKVC